MWVNLFCISTVQLLELGYCFSKNMVFSLLFRPSSFWKNRTIVNFSRTVVEKTADKQMGAANLGAGQFDADRWAPWQFAASPVCRKDSLPQETLGCQRHFGARHFGTVYTLGRRHFDTRDTLTQNTLWRRRHFGARYILVPWKIQKKNFQ